MGKMRTQSFLDVNEYIIEKYGNDALEQAKDQLNPEDREQLYSKRMSAVGWLDEELLMRDLNAKVKVLGKGDKQFCNKFISEMAQRQFTGIYKIVIGMANPETILKKTEWIWKRYYDSGRLLLDKLEPNHAVLKLVDYQGKPAVNHEVLLLPYLKRLLEITGATNVRCEHPVCKARDAEYCITNVDWE